MLGHASTTSMTNRAATTGQSAEALEFDAVSTVRGITFHLIDERLGRSVSQETIRRTVERLTVKSFTTTIGRDRWGMMTNSQRLEWLLSESQTLPLIGADDVVFLRSRRSR